MKTAVFALLFIMLSTGIGFSDVMIITNSSVPEASLTHKDIKEIFLGKKVQWSDSSKIHIVTVADPSLHESFLKEYIKRSPKQYKNYWKKMVFSGKGKKPKSFDSIEALMEYVSKTEGAVGYIDKNTTAVNVKTLTVE